MHRVQVMMRRREMMTARVTSCRNVPSGSPESVEKEGNGSKSKTRITILLTGMDLGCSREGGGLKFGQIDIPNALRTL